MYFRWANKIKKEDYFVLRMNKSSSYMFQTYVVFDESQGLLKPLKKLAYELDSQSKDLHD